MILAVNAAFTGRGDHGLHRDHGSLGCGERSTPPARWQVMPRPRSDVQGGPVHRIAPGLERAMRGALARPGGSARTRSPAADHRSRGGSWNDDPRDLRLARRGRIGPGYRREPPLWLDGKSEIFASSRCRRRAGVQAYCEYESASLGCGPCRLATTGYRAARGLAHEDGHPVTPRRVRHEHAIIVWYDSCDAVTRAALASEPARSTSRVWCTCQASARSGLRRAP